LSINDTASPDQSLQWNIQHKVVGNSRALANAILKALSTQLRLNGREEEINTTLEQALKRVELWFLNTDEEVLLLHGEVTIKLPSNAKAGGRCSHFALSMARFLAKQRQKSVFVALATDGADGNSEAAGAWVDNSTWKHLETKGLKPQLHLDSYNSYTALNAIGQQILFPRGHSNVRDIYLLVKYAG
jgi:glycerate-2-kinase